MNVFLEIQIHGPDLGLQHGSSVTGVILTARGSERRVLVQR